MWPLSFEEVVEILAIDFSEAIPKLDPFHRLEEDEILRIGSGLVIVDAGANIVQFAHFSVQEYLLSTRLSDTTGVSFYHLNPISSHTTLAQLCLSLLVQDSDTREVDTTSTQAQAKFAHYAADYWTCHAQHHADVTANTIIITLMNMLFNPMKPFFLLWQKQTLYGFYEQVKALLSEHASHVNVNMQSSDWETALQSASRAGHLNIVLQLDQGGSTNKPFPSSFSLRDFPNGKEDHHWTFDPYHLLFYYDGVFIAKESKGTYEYQYNLPPAAEYYKDRFKREKEDGSYNNSHWKHPDYSRPHIEPLSSEELWKHPDAQKVEEKPYTGNIKDYWEFDPDTDTADTATEPQNPQTELQHPQETATAAPPPEETAPEPKKAISSTRTESDPGGSRERSPSSTAEAEERTENPTRSPSLASNNDIFGTRRGRKGNLFGRPKSITSMGDAATSIPDPTTAPGNVPPGETNVPRQTPATPTPADPAKPRHETRFPLGFGMTEPIG
ncbi:hypothetical protein OF83DRAFT_1085002, partial [Amylostereum chailletii]